MKKVISFFVRMCAVAALFSFAVALYGAVEEYQKAVELDGNSVIKRYNLGVAYYKEDMADKALETLKQAYEMNREDKENHGRVDSTMLKMIGILYFNKNNYDDAITYFGKASEINPGDPDNFYYTGLSYYGKEKTDDALKAFSSALTKGYSDTTEINFRIGRIYYEKKEFAKAIVYLEKVTKSKKDHVEALMYLGAIYNERGNSEKAIDALKSVVKAKPDFSAYYMLGLNYFKMKAYDDMIEAYKKAIEIDPNRSEAHYNLGMAYYYRNMFEDAVKEFERAKEINPGDSAVYSILAQAKTAAYEYHLAKGTTFLTEEEYVKAKKEFEMALAAKPGDSEADKYLTRAKDAVMQKLPIRLEKAKKYFEKKNFAGAFNEWEAVLQADQGNQEANDGMASIEGKITEIISARDKKANEALLKGDYAGALDEYIEITRIAPKAKRVIYEEKLSGVRKKLKSRVTSLVKEANVYLTPENKNYKKALQKFNEILKYDENNEKALDGITKVNAKIEDDKKNFLELAKKYKESEKEKAVRYFRKVLDLDPNNEEANTGIRDLTGKQSQQAINAKEVRALYYEGVDKYVNGDIQSAIALWKRVLSMDPGHVEAKKNIERAREKLAAIQKLGK